MRAVITNKGATTRNGKPWLTIPHILAALQPLFDENPTLILDGELYCHGLHDDFNKISSLIKKTKPTPADLKECAEVIQFWWYDIVDSSLNFSARTEMIESLCKKHSLHKSCIVPVDTHFAHSVQDLDDYYGQYLENGYEGQMIRLDERYENKRSNTLLKRKEFQDSEYKIVEICEGNGNKSGMAGYAIMEREDGQRFRTNIKGNHTFLKTLLVDAESFVGSYATITYFNLTPDGIPRFPYLTRLRSGVGID
jgi:DNA ligase-1